MFVFVSVFTNEFTALFTIVAAVVYTNEFANPFKQDLDDLSSLFVRSGILETTLRVRAKSTTNPSDKLSAITRIPLPSSTQERTLPAAASTETTTPVSVKQPSNLFGSEDVLNLAEYAS